jgi:hypothetical protein
MSKLRIARKKTGTVLSSEGSSNATRTKIKRAFRPPKLPEEAISKEGQRTVRNPGSNISGKKRDVRHPRPILNSLGRVSPAPKEHRRVGSNVRPDAR